MWMWIKNIIIYKWWEIIDKLDWFFSLFLYFKSTLNQINLVNNKGYKQSSKEEEQFYRTQQEVSSTTSLTRFMANSTFLFIHQDVQESNTADSHLSRNTGGAERYKQWGRLSTSPLFQISPLWMSVTESISTNQGIHIPPHRYTLQLRQGGTPDTKTPESSRYQRLPTVFKK